MTGTSGIRQSPITQALHRRGFKVLCDNPAENLLIPPDQTESSLDVYYQQLKKYSFRLFLRDIIRFQESLQLKDLQKYCSEHTARRYLQVLVDGGLVTKKGKHTYQLIPAGIKNFGNTFEWFLAQVFIREYCCPAAWGIRLKETATGGDYDVIAIIEGCLLYVEAKSSPPKHVEQREIAAFLDRIEDLRPQVSMFLEDTRLRMHDKIAELFQAELASRAAARGCRPPEVKRLDRELFVIRDALFIINSKPDIAANIGTCIRHFLRNRGIGLFNQSDA